MGIRELSPELAKKSKEELGEDPGRISQDIQHIKDWAAKQPHLRARMDDQWIVAFLRGCKFSLERTKEKLDTFYTLRTTFPELTTNKDPMNPITKEIMKLGVSVPLPNRDPLQPRIMLIRPGTCDPAKYKILDAMKVSQMISDINLIEDDAGLISGYIYLLDLANVNIGHLTQFSPALMKKMATMSQEAVPIRQKGTHYINTPVGFETIVNTMKSFLNEKNRSRIHVHNQDMESLYKYIPKSVLPKEYGGDAGPIQEIVDSWRKRIENKREWYLDDSKYGTDESKRPGSPKTSESMFGLEGSFRQLNFD